MSYSAFFSLNQEIADTIRSIIEFYMPYGGTIYDPTCGKENHQFSSWMNQGRLDNVEYKYVCSDIQPYGDFIAELRHIPLKDASVDMTVLDVPFTPQATRDPRSTDYNIQVERTIEEIRAYFSQEIYSELARITKQFILVRGQDFYYPPNTTNLYSFYELALEHLQEASLALRALYPFRYNHYRLPLYRENLKQVVRPIITHGYVAVLAKLDAVSRRDATDIKHIVMKQNWNNKPDLEQTLLS